MDWEGKDSREQISTAHMLSSMGHDLEMVLCEKTSFLSMISCSSPSCGLLGPQKRFFCAQQDVAMLFVYPRLPCVLGLISSWSERAPRMNLPWGRSSQVMQHLIQAWGMRCKAQAREDP